jgi:starch synthase (maltosyl-transferring)
MVPRTMPSRVAVEDVWPRVDDGTVPIRRVPGDEVEVYADVFADGSAAVRASLRWREASATTWNELPMEPVGNDRWRGRFTVEAPGEYRYDVEGWVDPYLTWRTMLERRVAAGTTSSPDLEEGAELLRTIGLRVGGKDGTALVDHAEQLRRASARALEHAVRLASAPEIDRILAASPDVTVAGRSPGEFPLVVDPRPADHSAWYELFPRSTSPIRGQHGTFQDLRARLPYIADLGFDVVYLPPVHPIGRAHRRGPNNTPDAPPDAPGSPWAIGSAEGGHTAIHPSLGTLEEFRATVAEAHRHGLEIALDLAFQCSPDHPWVREHPSWFAHRPDGTIRTAENPPKKYEDIYPLDFGTRDWRALWTALKEVVDYWVAEGVRWFRVDNPHTKPFEFWRWLIGEVHRSHPDVMFLAEAFTRPKVMYRLAKVGFTHSYTYFAWRTSRPEIEAYFRELTSGAVGEFFRPHLWPNTPDILTEQFHGGQRSVFVQRLLLAATLAPHYGIYGPAYELLEHLPLEPGMEEYRDSEKYALRHWDLSATGTLAPEIRRINAIRRAHLALRTGRHLVFHGIDNERLLAYSRRSPDGSDVVLVVINLDPDSVQSGWTSLDLRELGVDPEAAFEVHDLWTDAHFRWRGPGNFVRLDPAAAPAHILHLPRAPSPGAGARSGRS